MASTKKKMTDKTKVRKLVALLKEIQELEYHEPNSDFYEYCNGCGRSPYNVPPHDEDCMVVKIWETLKDIGEDK
jgi:hypothetical protein